MNPRNVLAAHAVPAGCPSTAFNQYFPKKPLGSISLARLFSHTRNSDNTGTTCFFLSLRNVVSSRFCFRNSLSISYIVKGNWRFTSPYKGFAKQRPGLAKLNFAYRMLNDVSAFWVNAIHTLTQKLIIANNILKFFCPHDQHPTAMDGGWVVFKLYLQ